MRSSKEAMPAKQNQDFWKNFFYFFCENGYFECYSPVDYLTFACFKFYEKCSDEDYAELLFLHGMQKRS